MTQAFKFNEAVNRVLKPSTFSLTKSELRVNEYSMFWINLQTNSFDNI